MIDTMPWGDSQPMTQDAIVQLVYTKNGNVPADSLTRHTEWDIGSDESGAVEWIKCRVFYTDQSGDIVKDGADVYIAKGVAAMADAQLF